MGVHDCKYFILRQLVQLAWGSCVLTPVCERLHRRAYTGRAVLAPPMPVLAETLLL